jgi:4-hydroxy-tetrahydrodipicolinate synthase
VAGKMIKRMIEAYVAGDVETARELHLKLFPLFKVIFITTNPVPIKAAVELIGIKAGPPRLPLVKATVQEIDAVRKVMEDLNIIA